MHTAASCRARLQEFGHCAVDADGLDDAQALAGDLGHIVLRTEVRLDPHRDSYLCNPGSIPLHTDHPAAKYILWYCHEQDALAGSNEIVDARRVIQGLGPALQKELAKVRVPCPSLLGREPTTATHPLWEPQSESVFYAPWLVDSMPRNEALDGFERSLQTCRCHRTSLRLRPGQALILDNHRTLHGRNELPSGSARWLTRFWIGDPAPRLGAAY